jgi:hypothetical protein
MDFSLFDEASRDYDREHLERRTALVRTAVTQEVMPFLAMATSTEEYVDRRELAHNSLMSIATRHGASLAETSAVADRLYGLLSEARRRSDDDGLVYTANAMACGNCGHQSTDHTEGLRCQCGCTDFSPETSKQAMRREAGEGSGPFS